MIDIIKNEFAFLQEKGYSETIEMVTFVFKKLVYYKPNIKLIFECELMEMQFDFEIWVKSGDKEYSICERERRLQLHYQNKGSNNIMHESVFEYTKGYWDENSFQKRKEEIYKRKYGFNKDKKKFLEIVSLYKELLVVAINNIEMIL